MTGRIPNWFWALSTIPPPPTGRGAGASGADVGGFVDDSGVLRDAAAPHTESQSATSDAFGFKWRKRNTFEGNVHDAMRAWLAEKYGDMATAPWLFETSEAPVLLDAGCGAALSALALFSPVMDRLRYVGADISEAVNVAKARFEERGWSGAFMQADLGNLPLIENGVDLIFSEGVLHHTDDTAAALTAIVRHLKPGGRILFYVYRKKGPIREFADDLIRDRIQPMSQQQRWDSLMPLTKLGKILGDLDIEIDIPEPVDVLDIPAGRIDLQRLFYWHVFKAFYRPEMTLEEMNHINFDWYAPRNAHRHTLEEVHAWCRDASLTIEREREEPAGIAIVAKKTGIAKKTGETTCAA